MTSISRRNLLKGTALFGGTAMLGFNGIFGFSRVLGQETMADDDLQTILNLASTAVLFATTHYYNAIVNAAGLGLADTQVDYLQAAFISEQDHLELLLSLGAEPVVTEFYVPETLFSDKALFAATTEVAETAFVGAYLAAVRIFSKSADTTPYAVTCAQIGAVEETHRALVRQIGGLLPNNTSYAQYTLLNVSSAVPILQPFLDGSGEGFIGPVAPPTEANIAEVRAEAEAIGYDNPGAPFAAMTEMPA